MIITFNQNVEIADNIIANSISSNVDENFGRFNDNDKKI